MTKQQQLDELAAARVTIKEYLLIKYLAEDWHGVQDAASDLRDIDAEIKGLNF